MGLQDNIRNLRKAKGMTQEQLASHLDVTRQTISKWEKGLSVPDAELVAQLADIFDVKVSELLGKVDSDAIETNEIANYLATLNEELALKNIHRRKFLKILKIVLISFAVGVALLVGYVLFWVIIAATM